MRDPAYTQIGMDPRRHSQFYDKSTGLPVFSAEEKLQSGPLIIAPRRGLETTSWDDPRLELSDFPGKKYAAGGKVAKKALEFAKSVPFVHYSKAPNISTLDPNMYGTGIKGKEAARLKDAPDIKPRSYFYTQAGGRQPEQGLGPHKYQGVAEDIYPLHDDPAGFSQMAKVKAIDPYMMSQGVERIDEQVHLNELERLIKKAGYKGYANDDVGLLFDPTPVQKVDGMAAGGEVAKKLAKIMFDRSTGKLSNVGENQAVRLSGLGKSQFGDTDKLAQYVPERLTHEYALHPESWVKTFGNLTMKDPEKIGRYKPSGLDIHPDTLVGDMSAANRFYSAKTPEEAEAFANQYRESLKKLNEANLQDYKLPELLIPKK